MAGTSVADRLQKIRSRINEACVACGRDPASVRVLAVSKLHSLHAIREAYDEGQKDFAENYVQEAIEKLDQLDSLPVRWHFIGRLQTNKIKYIGNRFEIVHSVDRAPVADQLERVSTRRRQDIFLQYNVGGEDSKGGASEAGVRDLLAHVVAKCPALRVLGLMVMPPLGDGRAREHFANARRLLETLRAEGHPLDQLSMGTSADFEDAIKEGATWIRIGTEIFGAREEKT